MDKRIQVTTPPDAMSENTKERRGGKERRGHDMRHKKYRKVFDHTYNTERTGTDRRSPVAQYKPPWMKRDHPNAPCANVTKCANMKSTYDGMDGERYLCAVCGESYFLDYEEMR